MASPPPGDIPPPTATAPVRANASAPPRMRRGDVLGVVAPAGPVRDLARLDQGLARLADSFTLRLAPSLSAPRASGTPSYLAADDRVRAAELNAMLEDPDVRGIVMARGGYGVMRILPLLDGAALRRDPKPIVAFSDGTALLAWAHAQGVRGIHGPVGIQLAAVPDEHVAGLVALLSDPRPPGARPWHLVAHGAGERRGPLVPGNLTLFSLLVGTPWPLPLDGALALIEEVGERPYEIDRYLTQLILSGQLARAAALIVGDLTRCEDGSPPIGDADPADAALRVVLERAAEVGLSVAVGAPIGHGDRNEAVPFGAESILDLDRGIVEITEAAVA
jgi:muramoyltetrapeptide carboxypeptidase